MSYKTKLKWMGRDVTRVEALIARDAVGRAIEWVFQEARINGGIEHVDARSYVDRHLPLPTITRARVVDDPEDLGEHKWRCVNGSLWYRHRDASDDLLWVPFGQYGGIDRTSVEWPTLYRIRMWADLLANPNETIEDVG